MKLLKDTAAQCNVNNLIIAGTQYSFPENQISRKYRYIEKLPNITLNGIITDTKWISQVF